MRLPVASILALAFQLELEPNTVQLFGGLKQLITLRHWSHIYRPFRCVSAGSLLAHYLDDNFSALREV